MATANTSYSVWNIVIYNDKIYKCITGNNDATFKLLNWVCLSATGEEDIGHITFGYELLFWLFAVDKGINMKATLLSINPNFLLALNSTPQFWQTRVYLLFALISLQTLHLTSFW